ncbi:MAG: flagellar hook-associated protein FlgK [Sphingomonadaceae bacterium]|nr:flagellar hook-associated protein FlgK [Sphingomonadaceae bacterium]
MSDLLGIGASGVAAYSSALAAVGDNVSNAETKGYARRTVTIAEQPMGSSGLGSGGGLTVSGAMATSVGRAWNDYQAQATRTATAAAGRADARSTWLSAAETAMGDSDSTTSVGAQITAVYNAADALAGDPSDTSSRGAFLSALSSAASTIRSTAQGLATVSSGIAAQAQSTVQSVNASLDQLDQINAALVRAQPGSAAAATLQDQRDQLIDGISANLDVSVSLAPSGAATLTLAQDSSVTLTGTGGARLAIAQASDGRLAVSALAKGGSNPVGAPGGALAGLVESAGTVADRRDQLDAIATKFTSSMNSWSAGGTDGNGAAGQPLLSIGGDAATIATTTSDPAKVPAAAGGVANGNLLALQTVRTADGSEAAWASMVTDQAQMTSAANAESTSADTVRDSALSTRDETSGIDLDTEAADLLRYQQAYSGAAKIIQAARDTFQAILNIN